MAINSTFSNSTPHGGPPFTRHKNGFGFGKCCRSYIDDPSMPMPCRHSPEGHRYYDQNRFWRARYEVGRATAFGIGDRPDYGLMASKSTGGASVAPDIYGDVSTQVSAARPRVFRDVQLKARFPSMEEKYRTRPQDSGPGPAKYNTILPPGKGSRKFQIQTRHIDMRLAVEEGRKPGPSEYNTRGTPGENYPIRGGKLYNISLQGRTPAPADRTKMPGPGQYSIKRDCDQYNLTPGYIPGGHGESKPHSSSSADLALADLPEGDEDQPSSALVNAGKQMTSSASAPQLKGNMPQMNNPLTDPSMPWQR